MTGVSETAKMISELGIFVVIATFFVVGSAVMFMWMKRQNEEMFRKVIQEGHSVEEEEQNERMNRSIQDTLDKLLNESGSDCAIVFQYHNGGRNRLGIPFQKMSCTHEVVRPGLSGQFSQMQNMIRSLFMVFCDKLRDEGHYFIDCTDDIKEHDPNWYRVMLDFGVRRMFIYPLTSSEKVIFGFVAVCYAFSCASDVNGVRKMVRDKSLKISATIEAVGELETRHR